MPVFTAAAAATAAYFGVTSAVGIAAINFGVRAVATYMITSLLSNRDNEMGANPTASIGPGVQMPPKTDNKLPVVYGTCYMSPMIVDAVMSSDNSTMWYVMALSETTDTGTFSFDRAWWGDKELIFDGADQTKVIKWINSSDQENTSVNGNMYVYFYGDGSLNPVNTSQTAIQIMQDPSIPEMQRWTSNHLMSDTVFAIVKIIYNKDANTTGLEQLKVQLTNSLNNPGDVILDYLKNSRYGCGIPEANINVGSLTDLHTYSNEQIPYTTATGFSATMNRYEINGPILTENTCLTNIQQLVDACDCWLQWNEIEGQWGVVINQSYLDYTTYNDLFVIDSSNIIGGVDVTPIDLNSSYNNVEVQFRNNKIKDQTDYGYIELDPADMNPNEPFNRLTIQYPQVNNLVQAKYLGTRRLIQSREDLIVGMALDYSGIQIQAGDVVRVRHPVYGWGPIDSNPTNPDKLFRVNQVVEATAEDGSLGVKITLIEYNEQVYQNIDINDYDPETNSGIPNPGWISQPGAPTVTDTVVSEDGQIASFTVSATVPISGSVLYMDFYYGTSSDTSTHKLYRTVTPANGRQFTNGETVSILVNDLNTGTYYWSVKARSATSSTSGTTSTSPASEPQSWGGMKLLLPLLIGSQWLGGIAKEWMQPGSTGGFPYVRFEPSHDNYPLPVSDDGGFTRSAPENYPIIIPGDATTDYLMWWSEDWAGNGVYEMTYEGEFAYWKAINVDMTVFSADLDNVYQTAGYVDFIVDTLDDNGDPPIIQIAYYLVSENGIFLQEKFVTTVVPKDVGIPYSVPLSNINIFAVVPLEIGYMIRVLGLGSQVTLYSGQMSVKQNI